MAQEYKTVGGSVARQPGVASSIMFEARQEQFAQAYDIYPTMDPVGMVSRGIMPPDSFDGVVESARVESEKRASPYHTWKINDLITFGPGHRIALVPIVDQRGRGSVAGYHIYDILTGSAETVFRSAAEVPGLSEEERVAIMEGFVELDGAYVGANPADISSTALPDYVQYRHNPEQHSNMSFEGAFGHGAKEDIEELSKNTVLTEMGVFPASGDLFDKSERAQDIFRGKVRKEMLNNYLRLGWNPASMDIVMTDDEREREGKTGREILSEAGGLSYAIPQSVR